MKGNKKTKLKKEDDKDEQGWADIQDLFFSQQKKKWTTAEDNVQQHIKSWTLCVSTKSFILN